MKALRKLTRPVLVRTRELRQRYGGDARTLRSLSRARSGDVLRQDAMADRLIRRSFGGLLKLARSIDDRPGFACLPGGERVNMDNRWLVDPVNGYEWPLTYHERFDETSQAADILRVWWSSSFYHLVPMALAHDQLTEATERSALAEDFIKQVESWQSQNPTGFGPAWASTTIVSLRLVHLALARDILGVNAALPEPFCESVHRQIYLHARHVASHLEWFPVRTNHYLVNLFALYFVAVHYPEFPESGQWREFAFTELTAESHHHILEDGSVHEGSANYHRFVTEIFLIFWALTKEKGDEVKDEFTDRVNLAVQFLSRCVRPDGSLVHIGDAADIRLVNFDQRNWFDDVTHVSGLASALSGRQDTGQQRGLRVFEAGGYAFFRNDDVWLMVRCGRLALGGVSGHGHYDQLSFELWINGEPLLIDPGWFQYESDPEAFARFRSTRWHNTVCVDDRNQVTLELFSYPPPAREVPKFSQTRADESLVLIEGEHAMYDDLPDPVRHRRQFELDLRTRTLTLTDTLTGRESHDLAWSFHFAPGTGITAGTSSLAFRRDKLAGELYFEEGELSVEDAASAPRYGYREPSTLVNLSERVNLPVVRKTVLSFADG